MSIFDMLNVDVARSVYSPSIAPNANLLASLLCHDDRYEASHVCLPDKRIAALLPRRRVACVASDYPRWANLEKSERERERVSVNHRPPVFYNHPSATARVGVSHILFKTPPHSAPPIHPRVTEAGRAAK